jgi:hypothetical protein
MGARQAMVPPMMEGRECSMNDEPKTTTVIVRRDGAGGA